MLMANVSGPYPPSRRKLPIVNMKLKFLVLACVGGTILPVLAQTTSPAGSGAKITFAATDYDFGKVDSGTLVQHDYVFTNTGNQVLEINNVHPSCGCTTAGNWDKMVEPGQTGKIPVQFNSAGYAGQVHKSVLVTCNDPAQTNVTLTIQGTIEKLFDISPQYAVFNLSPEGRSNQTQVIKIVNNSDRAETVSDPMCASPAFKMELETGAGGQGVRTARHRHRFQRLRERFGAGHPQNLIEKNVLHFVRGGRHDSTVVFAEAASNYAPGRTAVAGNGIFGDDSKQRNPTRGSLRTPG